MAVQGAGLGILLSAVLLLGSPEATQAQASDEAIIEAMIAYLDQHPEDVHRRRQLVDRLVQENRIDAAITQLERLLELRPNDTAPLQQLIELYDWRNRPQDALRLYECLLRLRPNDPTVRYELARRYLWTDQIEASIQHLEIVVDQQPNDLNLKRELAQQYLWTNQFDRARPLLTHVVAEDPDDLDARRLLGDLYFWAGQPERGIQQLEWIAEHIPADLDIREQLAQQYFWTGQPQKGIQQLEWIVAHAPDRDSIRYELVQRYVQNAQTERGLVHLNTLVQRHPEDVSLRRELARHYQWTHRASDSIRQREILLDYAPTDRAARRALAEQLFSAGEPQRAFDHLHVLVQQHPDDRDFRSMLAHRYMEHGRLDEATEQYRWFIDHPPIDPTLATNLLQHLLWAQRHEEVISLGKQMLGADPAHTERRFHVARALAWSNHPEDAMRHIDTLLTGAPDHVEALLLGGEIQRWMPTEWPKARKKLERVLALAPGHNRAITLLHDLRRDHGSTAHTRLRYETDSNGRTHQYAPLRTDLWLGGRWHAIVEVGPHRFQDHWTETSATLPPLYGYEGTIGGQAQLANGTTLRLLGTATVYGTNWSPLGGTVLLRQPLGPMTIAAQYRRGEMRESATALRSKIRTHQLEGHLDLRIGTRIMLSGDGTRTWLSDANRKLDVAGTFRLLILAENPTFALRMTYLHEDTKQIFPDSRPYWTPDGLTTLSGALSLDVPVGKRLHVGGTYGLSEQDGTFGNDYGAHLRWSPGDFHSIQASMERFGSGTYAYRATSVQYAYRF